MKNIVSLRNEHLAKTSALENLWVAARTQDSEVTDDFIEEFVHLFKAMKGKSDVYPSRLMEGIESPDFDKYKGREAALKRSDFLDQMGQQMNKYIIRYPSGLKPEIVNKRIENKKRILEKLDGSDDNWEDWRWHRTTCGNGRHHAEE